MTDNEAKQAICVDGLEIKAPAKRLTEFFQGLVMADDALDKSIAKAPILEKQHLSVWKFLKCYCPMCGKHVGYIAKDPEVIDVMEYCSNCGQHLSKKVQSEM